MEQISNGFAHLKIYIYRIVILIGWTVIFNNNWSLCFTNKEIIGNVSVILTTNR